jgi:uncharacterized protein (TIGR00645 family)
MNKISATLKKLVENIIFSSRWLLIPFYLGLFVAMIVYTYVYIQDIWHLIHEAKTITKDAVLLATLELVDIVMIANLVKMIVTGSYTSFVDKNHDFKGEKVSSGMLKVKMSTSLIGVSSIHLLQSFINTQHSSWEDLQKQLVIHVTFLVGALILAVIDYLHEKSEHHTHSNNPTGH